MVPQFSDNTTKLVIVARMGKRKFLFIGNPAEIYSSTSVTEYVPKHWLFSIQFPDVLVKLCTFITTFSAALAVLNVVPSYLLDGQHMTRVIVEMLMHNYSHKSKINVTMGLSVLGTTLILVNVLFGLKSVLTSGSGSLVSFTPS